MGNVQMLRAEIKGNIVHVKECIPDASKKRYHWYYDITTWRQSSTGLKGAKIDRRMPEHTIQWVKDKVIPRLYEEKR